MKRNWRWITIAGVLMIVLGIGGYIWFQFEMKRGREALANFSFPGAVLGIRAGDVVPSEGRVIDSVTMAETTFLPPFPLVLYPGARVQGLNVSTFDNSSGEAEVMHAIVLMSTDDPEDVVIDYYLTAWAEFGARRLEPTPSTLYYDSAPPILEHTLITEQRDRVVASVDIQRGPAFPVMDDITYIRYLSGEADPALDPSAPDATEIWLWAPLHGEPSPRTPSSPLP